MSRVEISKHELKLLKQILSMRETSLVQSLPRILQRYYDEQNIHATKDYIYVTGDIPITLIAHLDTVHPAPPRMIYHDPYQNVLWSPDGLGADDRAGVFGIISLIDDGYRPSIIFTTKEETGGKGAFALVKDYPQPLVPTNFLVELDRQGINDAVYYDCGNQAFERFISSFGFETDIGSFSDIMVIGFEWDIAAVNLSIGYYNEHTQVETLHYKYMYQTINRVKQILENCDTIPFKYETVVYRYGLTDYPTDINFAHESIKCDCCDRYFPFADRVVCIDNTGELWDLCPQCAEMHSDPCVSCGARILNPLHREKNRKCAMCKSEDGNVV